MIYAVLKTRNFNICNRSSAFNTCLFDVTLPDDDLKKVEICRSISELYVKVYF